MAKRMRLPNGFGQISELKGRKLRNKWRVMITTGWTDDGKPIRKTIGYFKSYNEAYKGLMKYHENPYAFDTDLDMLGLYEQWSAKHYPTIKNSASYKSSWKYCESIYHMKVRDIRARHITAVVESEMPPTAHKAVKNILSMMLDFAVENDLIDKNYAKISSARTNYGSTTHHIPFTEDELQTLWRHVDYDVVGIILVTCYTGFRPREVLELRTENINLNEWTIVGGMKTASGTNRLVPIHDRIKPIVEAAYNEKNEFLFDYKYKNYAAHFAKVREALSLDIEHKPHDGRTTFVTRLKNAHADEYAIKLLVGHAISDITEAVYTVRNKEWLREELMKLT